LGAAAFLGLAALAGEEEAPSAGLAAGLRGMLLQTNKSKKITNVFLFFFFFKTLCATSFLYENEKEKKKKKRKKKKRGKKKNNKVTVGESL